MHKAHTQKNYYKVYETIACDIFLRRQKNIPSALCKILQGSSFHIDIERHTDSKNVRLVLKELAFYR